MKHFLSCILICATSYGCKPDCQGEFTFTRANVGDVGVAAISRTENAWSAFSGKPGIVRFVEAKEIQEICHLTFVEKISYINADENLIGFNFTFTNNIEVEIGNGSLELLHNILMHEVGHALGLEHVNNSMSIMYEEIRENQYWTQDDQDECESEGVCVAK